MTQELLNILEGVKETNNKVKNTLRTVSNLIEVGEIRRKDNVLEVDGTIELKTIYGKGATITIGEYPKQGSQFPAHCHEDIMEYLICSKGSFSAAFGKGSRIIKTGECLSISQNVLHTITALEDNSTLIAVCVPEDSAYLEILKCQELLQKKS